MTLSQARRLVETIVRVLPGQGLGSAVRSGPVFRPSLVLACGGVNLQHAVDMNRLVENCRNALMEEMRVFTWRSP
jgi:hypothetical protein